MKASNETNGTKMKDINTLKSGDIVTLNRDCKPMSGVEFKAGDKFKFLGLTGYGVRLSRIGDCAKLGVIATDIGYGELVIESTPEQKEAFQAYLAAEKVEREATDKHYATPHSDESGASRWIVTHTVLAGKDSGTYGMNLTPAEEREYNDGMAKLAEWSGD